MGSLSGVSRDIDKRAIIRRPPISDLSSILTDSTDRSMSVM